MSDRQFKREMEKRQRRTEKKTEAIGAKLSTLILVSLVLSPILGVVMNTYGPSVMNWTWAKVEYVLRIPGINYVYDLEKEAQEAEEARKRAIEEQAADVEALIRAREAGDTQTEAKLMVEMQSGAVEAYYASKRHAAKSIEKQKLEEEFERMSVTAPAESPPASKPPAEANPPAPQEPESK